MVETLDRDLLRSMPLPSHAEGGDKDARGRILIVGGSAEVPGGALLAGIAALRAGAGKLQIAAAAEVVSGIGVAVPEARVFPAHPDRVVEAFARCDAAVVGPGLLDEEAAADLVGSLLQSEGEARLLIDAAALKGARPCGRPVVLTPHAGEMANLLEVEKGEVEADAPTFARRAAERYDAIVALKGSTTWIADPQGRVICHRDGVFGLATSGSGDVLAGVIGGLLARGAAPLAAVAWGVFTHARAGAALSRDVAPLGFLAREIPDLVPGILAAQ